MILDFEQSYEYGTPHCCNCKVMIVDFDDDTWSVGCDACEYSVFLIEGKIMFIMLPCSNYSFYLYKSKIEIIERECFVPGRTIEKDFIPGTVEEIKETISKYILLI